MVWFLGIFGGFRVSLIFFSFSLLLFHFHKEAGLHFTPGIFEKTKKRIFLFLWFYCDLSRLDLVFLFHSPKKGLLSACDHIPSKNTKEGAIHCHGFWAMVGTSKVPEVPFYLV